MYKALTDSGRTAQCTPFLVAFFSKCKLNIWIAVVPTVASARPISAGSGVRSRRSNVRQQTRDSGRAWPIPEVTDQATDRAVTLGCPCGTDSLPSILRQSRCASAAASSSRRAVVERSHFDTNSHCPLGDTGWNLEMRHLLVVVQASPSRLPSRPSQSGPPVRMPPLTVNVRFRH